MRLAQPRPTVLAAAAAVVALCGLATAALPAAGAATDTHALAVPKPGSAAALAIGGPLMASRGIVVHQPAGHARPLPDIPASAWVIANATTGQVLAAKDPHGEFGPASTLKMLTAITLIPLLNPGGTVIASSLATSQQPNVAGLITGRPYKVADLFQALLLISANDAAVALTQATGSFTTGMALINAEARHLQAYDVVAKLPNGLPARGQVTSAYDEALIARQALALPAFMRYDETLAARFEVKPHDWETLFNQNTLLTKYRGGIGGKIGWTVSSAATYVGMARRNGVTLIATVLHCTPLQEITSAEKLLNWGFAMNGTVAPVGTLVPPVPSLTGPSATGPSATAPSATAPSAISQLRLKPAPSAISHQRHKPAPRIAAIASSRPAGGVRPASYGLAAGGVAVAAIGLGSLAWTRRRSRGSQAAARTATAGSASPVAAGGTVAAGTVPAASPDGTDSVST